MSMYKQFKTDPATEQEGIWLDYGLFRVRIARAGGANKDFQKEIERLTRPHKRAIQLGTLDDGVSETILMSAYAKAVIRAWETKDVGGDWLPGIEDPAGDDLLDVSKENILATFRLLPELYADIQTQAGSWALYKAALREEALGN